MSKDTNPNRHNIHHWAREEAKEAVDELRIGNLQHFDEPPSEIMEVLVSQWVDGWNEERALCKEWLQIKLKVRIPVEPEQGT
jgi:hypothetical protein